MEKVLPEPEKSPSANFRTEIQRKVTKTKVNVMISAALVF